VEGRRGGRAREDACRDCCPQCVCSQLRLAWSLSAALPAVMVFDLCGQGGWGVSDMSSQHCQDGGMEAHLGSIASAMLVSASGELGGGAPSIGSAVRGAEVVIPDERAPAEDKDAGIKDPSAGPGRPGAAGSEGSDGRSALAPARAGKRDLRLEKAVARAKTTAALDLELASDSLLEAREALSASIADVWLQPIDRRPDFGSEICESRLEFLRAVLGSGADSQRALAKLIHEVELYRRRPPCSSWMNLATLDSASRMQQEAYDALDRAQSKEEARPTLFAPVSRKSNKYVCLLRPRPEHRAAKLHRLHRSPAPSCVSDFWSRRWRAWLFVPPTRPTSSKPR